LGPLRRIPEKRLKKAQKHPALCCRSGLEMLSCLGSIPAEYYHPGGKSKDDFSRSLMMRVIICFVLLGIALTGMADEPHGCVSKENAAEQD
jgi:hypothetical protein